MQVIAPTSSERIKTILGGLLGKSRSGSNMRQLAKQTPALGIRALDGASSGHGFNNIPLTTMQPDLEDNDVDNSDFNSNNERAMSPLFKDDVLSVAKAPRSPMWSSSSGNATASGIALPDSDDDEDENTAQALASGLPLTAQLNARMLTVPPKKQFLLIYVRLCYVRETWHLFCKTWMCVGR